MLAAVQTKRINLILIIYTCQCLSILYDVLNLLYLLLLLFLLFVFQPMYNFLPISIFINYINC